MPFFVSSNVYYYLRIIKILIGIILSSTVLHNNDIYCCTIRTRNSVYFTTTITIFGHIFKKWLFETYLCVGCLSASLEQEHAVFLVEGNMYLLKWIRLALLWFCCLYLRGLGLHSFLLVILIIFLWYVYRTMFPYYILLNSH